MTTDKPRNYAVRTQGSFDSLWAAWLGDVRLTRNGDGTSTFVLTVADQTQLHGMLARLRDIGATLISLEVLDEEPDTQP